MRLNETEIENIKKLACLHFGEDVQVILFGSRANDEERGGDIDIFIRKRNGEKPAFRSKINFTVGNGLIRSVNLSVF
jgi:predicted nucleotidyltransferase